MMKGTKLLDMVSSSVKQAATSLRLRNVDAEFVREAKYFSDLSEKLGVMEKVGNRLYDERGELLTSQEDFSTVVFQWSMLEPKITQPLQKLANCVDNCSTALKSLVGVSLLLISLPIPSFLTHPPPLLPLFLPYCLLLLFLSPSLPPSPPPPLNTFSSSFIPLPLPLLLLFLSPSPSSSPPFLPHLLLFLSPSPSSLPSSLTSSSSSLPLPPLSLPLNLPSPLTSSSSLAIEFIVSCRMKPTPTHY